MKTLSTLAMVLLFGIAAFAQPGPEKGRKQQLKDFTPEQIAILHTKKMTLALDLSEKQQTDLLALNTELARERKVQREEMKKLKDNGVTLTSQQRFEKMNERLDRQIEVHNKMKKLLDEEQFSLWKKYQLKKGMKKHAHNMKQKRNG